MHHSEFPVLNYFSHGFAFGDHICVDREGLGQAAPTWWRQKLRDIKPIVKNLMVFFLKREQHSSTKAERTGMRRQVRENSKG